MSKPCPACLWISSDAAEECERCGAPFDGSLKPEITAGGVWTLVKTIIGVVALGILGVVAFQKLNPQIPNAGPALRAGVTTFYYWLLGPNEVLKPFIIVMLVAPLFILFILWLLARLQ